MMGVLPHFQARPDRARWSPSITRGERNERPDRRTDRESHHAHGEDGGGPDPLPARRRPPGRPARAVSAPRLQSPRFEVSTRSPAPRTRSGSPSGSSRSMWRSSTTSSVDAPGCGLSRKLKRLPDPPAVLIYSAFSDYALAAACVVGRGRRPGQQGRARSRISATRIREVASRRTRLPIVAAIIGSEHAPALGLRRSRRSSGCCWPASPPTRSRPPLGLSARRCSSRRLWTMLRKLERLDIGEVRLGPSGQPCATGGTCRCFTASAGMNALLLVAAVVVTIVVLAPHKLSSFAADEAAVLVARAGARGARQPARCCGEWCGRSRR